MRGNTAMRRLTGLGTIGRPFFLPVDGYPDQWGNVHPIKPPDTETVLASVRKTGCALACEEHDRYGGLGDAIAQTMVTLSPAPREYVAVNDTFGESGTPEQLLRKYGLDTPDITAAALRAIKRK